MEQNASQNKIWEFLDKYQIYVIVAILVAGAIIYSVATRDKDDDNLSQNQNTQQTANENSSNGEGNQEGSQGQSGSQSGSVTGNVSATGTLRASDDSSRGNLMVDSNRGKIYIATARNFTDLLGKEVTMNAEGNINQFKFLGLTEGKVAGVDHGDVGGAPDETPVAANVTFSGTLKTSDNQTRGNYVITSGSTKVYLQSARDYSGWLDLQVTLTANGTINSFTGAVLVKK